MSWLVFYVFLMVLPALLLALAEWLRVHRRESRRNIGGAGRGDVQRTTAGFELEDRWIAVRAQYLVAPRKALAEADDLLTPLAIERGWLQPGERASSALVGVPTAPVRRAVGSYVSPEDMMRYFDWLVERLAAP